MGRRKTQEEVIGNFKKIHGDRYDYSIMVYVETMSKVTIKCYQHGPFDQTPNNHLNGKGCPECGKMELIKNRSNNKLLSKFKYLIQPDEYKLIPLSKGRFSKVDNDDFEKLKDVNWGYSKGYAKNKHVSLHSFILNSPVGKVVDHINHDTLDNRKSNLRICSRHENSLNKSIGIGYSSIYKGVTWHKKARKWASQIHFNYKSIYLGLFTSEIEAAKSYDRKARELFGEFALTNF